LTLFGPAKPVFDEVHPQSGGKLAPNSEGSNSQMKSAIPKSAKMADRKE
jgi:hypothetical protein